MNQQRRIELVTERAVESAIKYFDKYLDAELNHCNERRQQAMEHYKFMSEEALRSITHLKLQLSPKARDRLGYLSLLTNYVSDIVLGNKVRLQAA